MMNYFYTIEFQNKLVQVERANVNQELYVKAPATRDVPHGDFKTQAVRDYFMGVKSGQTGRVVGVTENLYGIFVQVQVDDGKGGVRVAEVKPQDLTIIPKSEYEQRTTYELPPLESAWVHEASGSIYIVYDHTNVDSTKEKYPTRISYISTATGKKHSGDLSDWYSRMRRVR